jgi:hypothetical protein
MEVSPAIEGEEWRPVRRAPGYYVSSEGRVASCRRIEPRIIAIYRNEHGNTVPLRVKRTCKMHALHAVVGEAFHGRRPDGCRFGFKDGDRYNSKASNILYVSRPR